MKKKAAIPIIIVLAVIAFYSLCFSGYKLLSEHNDLVQRRAIYNNAVKFIKEDEEFIAQYGEVSKITPADDYRLILTQDRDFIICCGVTVSGGDNYDVILKWKDDTFSYTAIEKK